MKMVSAGTGEEITLYTLSPTVLERPRAMSRLRLPVGISDSILQRAPGNTGKMPIERSGSTPHGRSGTGGVDAANGHQHSGLRSPKQFPGAIAGHSPTTWRKPGGQGNLGGAPADSADMQFHKQQQSPAQQQHLVGPCTPTQPHQVTAATTSGDGPRPKSLAAGFAGPNGSGGGNGGGISTGAGNFVMAASPPGTLSIITHILETQAQPAQAGWSPPTKNQPPRAAFRSARQSPAPSGPPRAPSPAVLQYISAASTGNPLPPHLQPGNHRHGLPASISAGLPHSGASVGGGGVVPLNLSLPITGSLQAGSGGGGGRRQSVLQRQSSQQQQQQQRTAQQTVQQLEAWPSIHSEPSGRDRDESSKATAADAPPSSSNASSEHGGVPLPPLSSSGGGGSQVVSTSRRSSSTAGEAAAATAVATTAAAPAPVPASVIVGPSTPLHVAKLQNSAWATDPVAVISPGMISAVATAAPGSVSGGTGSAGHYVFRNAGRSALLAAAESGLIGINSLPAPSTADHMQFAPSYWYGTGTQRPHGTEAYVEGDMGSLAWRITVRYCRRRRLSGAFRRWLGLVHKLHEARRSAEAMRRKREMNMMMAAFTGWLHRVWRRQQQRRNLARATRRRLRVYLAAWREQSVAQADAYRLWLLEQVTVVCPQALGAEGHSLMEVLQQRQEEYNARLEARQQVEGQEVETETEMLVLDPEAGPAVEAEAEADEPEGAEKGTIWGALAHAITSPEMEMDLGPQVEHQAEAEMESEEAEELEAERQAAMQTSTEEEDGARPHVGPVDAGAAPGMAEVQAEAEMEGEREEMDGEGLVDGELPVPPAEVQGRGGAADAAVDLGQMPGERVDEPTLMADAVDAPASEVLPEAQVDEEISGGAVKPSADLSGPPFEAVEPDGLDSFGRLRLLGEVAADAPAWGEEVRAAIVDGEEGAAPEALGDVRETEDVVHEVSLYMSNMRPIEEGAGGEGAEASLQFVRQGTELVLGQGQEGLAAAEWSEGLGFGGAPLGGEASRDKPHRSVQEAQPGYDVGKEESDAYGSGGPSTVRLGEIAEAADNDAGQGEEVEQVANTDEKGEVEDMEGSGGEGDGYGEEIGDAPGDVLQPGEAAKEHNGLGGKWEASVGYWHDGPTPQSPSAGSKVLMPDGNGGVGEEVEVEAYG